MAPVSAAVPEPADATHPAGTARCSASRRSKIAHERAVIRVDPGRVDATQIGDEAIRRGQKRAQHRYRCIPLPLPGCGRQQAGLRGRRPPLRRVTVRNGDVLGKAVVGAYAHPRSGQAVQQAGGIVHRQVEEIPALPGHDLRHHVERQPAAHVRP